MKAHEWLQVLYDRNKIYEDGLDEIYEVMDNLLSEERLLEVDAILSQIDVEKLSPVMALGFLSITRPARDHLKTYEEFCDKVVLHVRKVIPDRCDTILSSISVRSSR